MLQDTDGRKEKSRAFGKRIFRGEDFGVTKINSCYKSDWRMVPKDDEYKWLKATYPPREKKVVPDTASWPPLLAFMIRRDMTAKGIPDSQFPVLKLHPKNSKYNKYEKNVDSAEARF